MRQFDFIARTINTQYNNGNSAAAAAASVNTTVQQQRHNDDCDDMATAAGLIYVFCTFGSLLVTHKNQIDECVLALF